MNENEKNRDAKRDEDYVFEGGTGGDNKTTADDLRKAEENKQAYEGLRSMIINPDDGEDEREKDAGKEKENPAETGGE